MSENRVVVYSNGIADFQRSYSVTNEKPLRISIPVRQDHLGDVLASFNIYGDIALDSPPTFKPSNELEGNITIQAGRVLEDLATSLSGARVRVIWGSHTVEGTLVGLHEEEEATAGDTATVKSLVILTEDGLSRAALREIRNLLFLDEDVQQEIDKALQRNFQRIKPNSTFVELTVSTTAATAEAVLQYAIPAAAWKISYRLQTSKDQHDRLLGFAVVDNNTDEDWNGFNVCVVTGEPITFSTDLADSKSPSRKHLNLVSESALGAVEVEAPVMMAAGSAAEFDEDGASASYADIRGGGAMMLSQAAPKRRMAKMQKTAAMDSATVEEVGDFCIFKSQSPVTIPAKHSAVIPVFDTSMPEAKAVLHFKAENHAERPYRAIQFKNETEFSLGRGVCTVFEDGAYGGNCVMPSMKTGEVRLLPHALETGVAIQVDKKRQRNKVVAIELADGVCYTSRTQRRRTEYRVMSSRDHEFELFLDHENSLSESKLTASVSRGDMADERLEATTLADGTRFSLRLPARAELVVNVEEKRLERSEVRLVEIGKQENVKIRWLEDNLVKTNGPLANDAGVKKCLQLFGEREAVKDRIEKLYKQTEQLTIRQERLRKNIKSGGQDEITNRWRQELDESERSIQAIDDEKVPALREQEEEIQTQLRHAMKSLSAEWFDTAANAE